MQQQVLRDWLELLRFEYEPLENDAAVVRLLAGLDAKLRAPASPALLVRRGSVESWYSAVAGSIENRRVRGIPGDPGSGLLWRASFTLPLEVVQYPEALFTLTSSDHVALALPAPMIGLTALAHCGDDAKTRSWPSHVRRHATAVAAGFAVAAGCGSAVGAAAADTVSTGKDTTATAQTSVSTTTTTSTTVKAPPKPTPPPAPPSSNPPPASPPPPVSGAASQVTQYVPPPHCPPGTVLVARLRGLREIPLTAPKPWCVVPPAKKHASKHAAHRSHHGAHRGGAPAGGKAHLHVQHSSGGAAITPPAAVKPTPPPAVSSAAPAAPQWGGAAVLDPFTAAEIAHFQSLAGGLDQPPKRLIKVYKAAGRRYHVPWQILAAINAIETDYGRNLSVSTAGAIGWMQFMPETWLAYGTDANHDGSANPYDPADAIYSAARYLRANGAPRHMRKAIFAYNHALWYVDAVLWRAQMVSDHEFGKGHKKHGYALPLDGRYLRELGRTDDGVDIEAAPNGAAVYSIAPGIVTAVASDPNGFGPNYPVVLVTKGPLAGQYIYYGHVAASLVKVHQHVLAGQPIAVMGHTGDAASLGHGHIEIGFSDAGGDPLNHHGAGAWTPSGDAMRHVLVALSRAFKVKNSQHEH